MKFSDFYKVPDPDQYDWFDPVMSLDTQLFLDPFLVYADEDGVFVGSHAEIIAFFNAMYRLVAESRGNPGSVHYRKAQRELVFPEVEEICLGYTSSGTKGSGSGGDYARTIAKSIWEAIKAGITEITHFEEIGLLTEGIGADRISDMAATLLRPRISQYTESWCKKLGVRTEEYRFARGAYNEEKQFWIPLSARLPRNPYNNHALMLVPKRYLRDLPTINAFDFWDFGCSNENESIRSNFNYDVSRGVKKSEIIAIARSKPKLIDAYLEYCEERGSEPYNLENDTKGYVHWYAETAKYCAAKPIKFDISTETQLAESVRVMIEEFRHFVEENSGWQLLWNDRNQSRSEKAAQLLFLGIVKHYCQANDIDVSKEANIGRGPVDFKVSRGFLLRALVELKLARNSKFWSGLQKQLPTYLRAEGIKLGYFVVVCYSEHDLEKVAEIQKVVRDVANDTGTNLHSVIVDASTDHPSASLL